MFLIMLILLSDNSIRQKKRTKNKVLLVGKVSQKWIYLNIMGLGKNISNAIFKNTTTLVIGAKVSSTYSCSHVTLILYKVLE